MSKHSHISAIFDNAFQSRAGSPDVYMSMAIPHPHLVSSQTDVIAIVAGMDCCCWLAARTARTAGLLSLLFYGFTNLHRKKELFP